VTHNSTKQKVHYSFIAFVLMLNVAPVTGRYMLDGIPEDGYPPPPPSDRTMSESESERGGMVLMLSEDPVTGRYMLNGIPEEDDMSYVYLNGYPPRSGENPFANTPKLLGPVCTCHRINSTINCPLGHPPIVQNLQPDDN
ncbi:hypothetical protein Tco_1389277, partial [Tanacetum coccineum]